MGRLRTFGPLENHQSIWSPEPPERLAEAPELLMQRLGEAFWTSLYVAFPIHYPFGGPHCLDRSQVHTVLTAKQHQMVSSVSVCEWHPPL